MKRSFFAVWVTVVVSAVSACGLNLRAQLPFTVLDYSPAPGQFVDYSEFLEPGQDPATLTMEQVCAALNTRMGELPLSYLVSLGGFGGEITVRLNTTLANGEGTDFKVYGNAFYTGAHTPELSDRPGGNAEPGVIWVSRDVNGNGLADDPWYEIAGSEYNNPKTGHNYRITYYEPEDLSTGVFWGDSDGFFGTIERNTFHTQPSYYPIWVGRDSISFTGTRLPNHADWESYDDGSGQFILYCFDWGYADNHPNSSDLSNIDIDWAVDADGEPVHLQAIDFVKVVSGHNLQLARLGEISTEFAGVEPLHDASANEGADAYGMNRGSLKVYPNPCGGVLYVENFPSAGVLGGGRENVCIMDKTGRILRVFPLEGGGSTVGSAAQIDMSAYPAGIYLLRSGSQTVKVIKL